MVFPCKIFTILGIGVMCVCVLLSEEPLETSSNLVELDIQSAAYLARKQAEAVLAASTAVEASLDDRRADLAFAYPQLRIGATYTRNEELATFPFGPFGEIETGRRNDYRGSVHAEQLLWSFGKRSAVSDRADANTAAARAQLVVAGRDAANKARRAVTSVLFARARLEVAEERVSQRREELNDAQDLFQAGIVTELDVRQASINLIRAENEFKAIQTDLKQAHFEVAEALALEHGEFLIKGNLRRPTGVTRLLSAVREQIDVGAEISVLLARYDSHYAERRNIWAEGLPEVRAVADGSAEGDDLDTLEDAWSVGINITWDLYNGGDRNARKAATTERMHELQLRKDELVRNRRKQVESLAVELDFLDKRIAREKEAVDLAMANYHDARDQYRAGLITLTRLGESSLSAAEARFRYLSLINEEQTAVNELLQLQE